jgi:uncharacterized membrane protein YjdF
VIRRNRDAAMAVAGATLMMTAIALVRHDAARLRPYLQVVLVLVVATSLADRAAHFSRRMVWALASVVIVHLIGGLMVPLDGAPTFYETWLIDGVLKFDQLAHAYGTGVLTVACSQLVVGLLGSSTRRGWGLGFVAALMACGLGALNELVEFLFGLGNANLHAGGIENTGWDLAFNLAGATVGAWVVAQARGVSADTTPTRAPSLQRR